MRLELTSAILRTLRIFNDTETITWLSFTVLVFVGVALDGAGVTVEREVLDGAFSVWAAGILLGPVSL